MNSNKKTSVSLFKPKSQYNQTAAASTGTSLTFGTTGSTAYKGLSNIYFNEKTFQIEPTDVSSIIISSGLNIGVARNSSTSKYDHVDTLLFDSNSGFNIIQHENKSITIASNGAVSPIGAGPPPDISFGTPTSTSRYIYIPWTYPEQIIIGDTYLPYINSFTAYYTIHDISTNIILRGSGSDYIKGPPSTSNQQQTYITGIILTNVPSESNGVTWMLFPNEDISRNCYIYYDSSLHLFSGADASGSITAFYKNYSGYDNASILPINGFSAAGVPSRSTDASFSYTISSLNTKNVDISVNVLNTTPYTNARSPWIDKLATYTSTYQIEKYKYTYVSNGSTIRYGGPVADTLKNISGNNQSQTIHYLYPDISYMLYEQVNNNSSPDASYSSISDAFSFYSQSLQVRALCSELKFPTLTQSFKSSYLVTDTNRQNLKSNVVFTDQSGDVKSDHFISPIHTLGTRGNLISNGTTLLDISCTITKSGDPTPIDSVSISYKGFPAIMPTATTGQGICTIETDALPVDSYADSLSQYQGFYLETSNNIITLHTNSTALFSASNQLNTIKLAYIRRNNVLNTTHTDISYSPYSFYYDPSPCINALPVWTDVSFTAVLRSSNPSITAARQICGVYVLSGAVGVNTTTTFINYALGRYFYNSGNIITYSNNGTNVHETSLANVSPAINPATGHFSETTTFNTSNASTSGYISYNPSSNTWSNSFYVGITNYINCLGKSPTEIAPSSKKVTFNGIWDPLSINALQDSSAIPVVPVTGSKNGCRVETGVSDATCHWATTIGTSGVNLIITPYPNNALLSDSSNIDLQLSNGIYATKLGSVGTGYLNYTDSSYVNPSIYNAPSNPDYSSIQNTHYRYVTFAWILPPGTKAAPLQYSKVAFTIDGLVGDSISNIDTIPTIGSSNAEFTMQYRIQNGDPDKKAPSQSNKTSVWINAFPGPTTNTIATAPVIVNPIYNGKINGDDTAIPNSYESNTLKVYSLISSAPTTTTSSGVGSFYLYCRIGLPMSSKIGFKTIIVSFS